MEEDRDMFVGLGWEKEIKNLGDPHVFHRQNMRYVLEINVVMTTSSLHFCSPHMHGGGVLGYEYHIFGGTYTLALIKNVDMVQLILDSKLAGGPLPAYTRIQQFIAKVCMFLFIIFQVYFLLFCFFLFIALVFP
jgi:hypothetical protein